MCSPSRITRSRNTPCVDGCCGPMLTTNGSVLIGTELASPEAGVFLREALEAGAEAARERAEVLAQRVAGKAVPEEQPLQARVSLEPDAQQVVRLALLQVGAVPNRNDGRHDRVVVFHA